MSSRKYRGAALSLPLLFSLLLSLSCTHARKSAPSRFPPPGLHVVVDVQEYRAQVAADPEMELVDLQRVIPGLPLDIRYATKNNFTGEVIYTEPKAYLRKPVAEALKGVAESLAKKNLGLKIYDAYRPYTATVRFYEVCRKEDRSFVADPRDGSRHNRGCAVDLTLVDLGTGREIPMPSDFDDFSAKAHPLYQNLPPEVLDNRAFLIDLMARFGFRVFKTEWWHYDFIGWEKYPLMDLSFQQLK